MDYEQQLPVALATRSLELFQDYGDVYQTSGAWRTLAACYRQLNDYEGALYCLEQALADSAIFQAPDLVASIREQLSVVYAAMGDKPMSDHNRNLYLDLQEQTRQDRSLEARARQYDQAVGQLNRLLMALGGAIVLLLLSLLFFYYSHRRRRKGPRIDQLLQPLNDWNERVRQLHLRQEEQRGNEAVFVCGHNGHIRKSGQYGPDQDCMGALLAADIGEDGYFAIGTDFFKATDNLPLQDGRRVPHTLYSYDPLAKAADRCGYDICWLDFAAIPQGSPLREQADGYINMGMIGEVEADGLSGVILRLIPAFYRITYSPGKMYDGMIFVSDAHPIEIRE